MFFEPYPPSPTGQWLCWCDIASAGNLFEYCCRATTEYQVAVWNGRCGVVSSIRVQNNEYYDINDYYFFSSFWSFFTNPAPSWGRKGVLPAVEGKRGVKYQVQDNPDQPW